MHHNSPFSVFLYSPRTKIASLRPGSKSVETQQKPNEPLLVRRAPLQSLAVPRTQLRHAAQAQWYPVDSGLAPVLDPMLTRSCGLGVRLRELHAVGVGGLRRRA